MGGVRDYQHAARLFRTSNFARAPKYKTLFFVRIVLQQEKTELNYLVKSAELPKFEMDVQDVNQYNRKVIVQRQIKYNPVTIKFHDDNTGTLREFWQNYYNYYYDDGNHSDSDFLESDLYRNSRKNSNWGFSGKAGQQPYIKTIEIYSMHKGKAQTIILESPIISGFSHDTHDQSDLTTLMEASMTLHYTGVRYEFNKSAGSILGFISGNAYDTNPQVSDNLGSSGGLGTTDNSADSGDLRSDTGTTSLYGGYGISQSNIQAQQSEYNKNTQSDVSSITDAQIGNIARNSFLTPKTPFKFPVITPDLIVNSTSGSTELTGNYAVSNNEVINSPNNNSTNYPTSSWQALLYQKGYSGTQIYAAEEYIKEQGVATFGLKPNWQQIATTYIQNPKSSKLTKYGATYFGQSRNNSTKINFSNPAAATQPVYNGLGWQTKLLSLGYSQSEISNALKFISNLKVTANTDLTNIAINYINNSKQKGSITNSVVTKTNLVNKTTELVGPDFNSTLTTAVIESYGKL
jgi:hypothetical protein